MALDVGSHARSNTYAARIVCYDVISVAIVIRTILSLSVAS